MRRTWRGIHLYMLYALFQIPSDRWLICVPLQTTANYDEELEIRRFLSRRHA